MTTVLIKLKVNEETYKIKVKPQWTLLHVIRNVLGLKGTKMGCGTGECGACTVIMNGKAVHSCLVLAAQADKKEITTIEGLSNKDKLHPLQEAFIKCGAIQCGFCTPGMILTAKAFLEESPVIPTEEKVREWISGNICRCTGYAKIVEAILAAAEMMKEEGHR